MKPGVVDPSFAMTGATLIVGGTKSATALAVWVLVVPAVKIAPDSTTPPVDAADRAASTTRAIRARFTPPPPGRRGDGPRRPPRATRARASEAQSGSRGKPAARCAATARRARRT